MQFFVNLATFNATFEGQSLTRSACLSIHRGEILGPFTANNVPFTDALNLMDGACFVFNGIPGIQPPTSRLSRQILEALGLRGKKIKFTACSFLGSTGPGEPAIPPLAFLPSPLGLRRAGWPA